MSAERLISVIIICDSRGKWLQEKFRDERAIIKVLTFSGAKLYQSIKLAQSQIKREAPDQIYILSGLNSMTQLNRKTRKVSLIAPLKSSIVQNYTDEMNFSITMLRKITGKETKIIFAPVIGMNLAVYNGTTVEQESNNQTIFNDALLDINTAIIAQNNSNHCKTPWIHTCVHRYFRGKYHFNYEKLDSDSCHLTEEIRNFWARKLIVSIKANQIAD